MPQNLEKR